MRRDPAIDSLLDLHGSKFRYAGRILTFDHKHRHATDQGVPYEFKDVQQLINDFFADVDRIPLELKKR